MAGYKDWWRSRTLIGFVILILPVVLRRFGMDLGAEDAAELERALVALSEVVGSFLVVFGRLWASKELVVKAEPLPVVAALALGLACSGCGQTGQAAARLWEQAELRPGVYAADGWLYGPVKARIRDLPEDPAPAEDSLFGGGWK